MRRRLTMMGMSMETNQVLKIVICSLMAASAMAGEPGWLELSKVGKAKTHGATAFWGGLPELNPKAKIKVLDVDGPGVITSFHVSAMTADGIQGFGSAPVAGLTSGFFLDGDAKPTLQSMGSEDLYGGSWGFIEPQGDGQYTSVLRNETLGAAGSRIAVMRCRSRDAVSFRKSCKWLLTWENDRWAADKLGDAPIPYRHCVYYYSKD
jgi:hypothetical protein